MQTSTPKRTRLVYPPSPLRRDQDSDDFSDMPEYIPPIKTVHRRGPRGRDAINEIAQIVGSKRFRDIKRSGNFMPGQFDIWNAKETGGNNQYWGGYQDVDGDGLAHEFVVRREKETGPMVAVNANVQTGQHVKLFMKTTQAVKTGKVRPLKHTCEMSIIIRSMKVCKLRVGVSNQEVNMMISGMIRNGKDTLNTHLRNCRLIKQLTNISSCQLLNCILII